MFIYVILIIILFLCTFINFNDKAYKKGYIFVAFFALTAIAALRSKNVGVDTLQYYKNFSIIANLGWSHISLTRYEIGFFVFCKLLSYISTNPQILIVASSLIIIPHVGYLIYKESNHVAISTLLYVLLNIYFFNLTGMRQSLATCFIIIAFIKYKDKHYIGYLLNVLLAALFHSSAVIFLLLPIIDKIKYNKKTIIGVAILAIVCFLASGYVFKFATSIIEKYAGYEGGEFGVSNYFGAVVQAAFYWFLYIISHELLTNEDNEGNSRNKLLLKMMAIATIFETLSIKMQIFSRMASYFWIFSIIAIPEALCQVKGEKNKFYLNTILYIVIIVYWFIIAIYRPEWNGTIPYETFMSLLN